MNVSYADLFAALTAPESGSWADRPLSRKVPVSNFVYIGALSLLCSLQAVPVRAQYYVNGSTSWSSSWGFGGSVLRSVDNQQADIIAKRRGGYYESFGPANTVLTYNTVNDNRSNYLELDGDQTGTLEVSNKVGDDIGKNTNVIGAMNTGNTEISIDGSNNNITAINSADSAGCLDGSINISTSNNNPGRSPSALAGILSGIDGNINGGAFGDRVSARSTVSAGSSQSHCQ